MSDRNFRPFPIWVLYLFGALCFLTQVSKSVDLQGYLGVVRDAWTQGFDVVPYPRLLPGTQELNGAYFQSPVTTLLLLPLALTPLLFAKILHGLVCIAGFIAMVRHLLPRPIPMRSGVLLCAVFVYPLSDVFLSANIGFPMILCIYFGWVWSQRADNLRWGGALLLALSLFMKPIALIAMLWVAVFLGRAVLRRVMLCAAGLGAMTFLIMGVGDAGAWWQAWDQALLHYPIAGHPGRDAFQSPPAAVFRILLDFTDLSFETKYRVANAVGFTMVAGLFFFAFKRDRQDPLPTLLAATYVCSPFAWACTILALFPLVARAVKDLAPPPAVYALALTFAVAQKALLPPQFWDWAIHRNMHAWMLIAFGAFALWKSSQGKRTQTAKAAE